MANAVTARLVSTGSILVDLTFRVPHPPEPGGDVLASPPTLTVAGGFNLLVAAARQGISPVYAGTLGSGPYGALVAGALVAAGVVAANPPRTDGDTGLCVVLVDDTTERTFVTSPGVETLCTIGDLNRCRPTGQDLVAVSGYDLAYPQSGEVVAEWIAGLPDDTRVALDPGPMVADIPPVILDPVLARIDILSVNQREAGLLTGRTVPGDGHAELRSATPLRREALLVIRSGPDGCTVDGGPDGLPVTAVPAPTVVAVDTTGAGDAHLGVFLAGLVQGRGVLPSLSRGNIAGAVSVTRSGPAEAPTAAEIDMLVGTS